MSWYKNEEANHIIQHVFNTPAPALRWDTYHGALKNMCYDFKAKPVSNFGRLGGGGFYGGGIGGGYRGGFRDLDDDTFVGGGYNNNKLQIPPLVEEMKKWIPDIEKRFKTQEE